MPSETGFLRHLARCFTQGEAYDAAHAPATDDLKAWDRRFQRLLDHNVFGALVPLIPDDGFDETQRRRLRETLAGFDQRNLLMLMELERILPRLEAADCLPVVLKGAALATSVYERPGQRFLADLDILVPVERRLVACEELIRAGYSLMHTPEEQAHYEKHHFHWALRNARGNVIEVHWALTLPDSIYSFDLDGLRERAIELPLGQGTMLAASPRDQILHAVLQCSADGFSNLRRILDTALLLGRLESPGMLIDQARGQNLHNGLWILLTITEALTGAGLESALMESIAPRPRVRRLLESMDLPQLCVGRHAIRRPDLIFLLHALSAPNGRLLRRELRRYISPSEGALLEMGFEADEMPGWRRRRQVGFRRVRSAARILIYLLSRRI